MNKHLKPNSVKANYNSTDSVTSQMNPNDNSKYNLKNNNQNMNDKIN